MLIGSQTKQTFRVVFNDDVLTDFSKTVDVVGMVNITRYTVDIIAMLLHVNWIVYVQSS